MKSILRTTALRFGLFVLLNMAFSGNSYALTSGTNVFSDIVHKNIDLGCITKQIVVKANYKNGLLVKSKKFVFYINRKQKQILFVSDSLAFSKDKFNCI